MVTKGTAVVAIGVAGAVLGFSYLVLARAVQAASLSLTLVYPSIAQGSNEIVNIVGASPYGQLQVQVITNIGTTLTLTPNPIANAAGAIDYSFNVNATNIPKGTNTVKVTDLNTGASASVLMTVT